MTIKHLEAALLKTFGDLFLVDKHDTFFFIKCEGEMVIEMLYDGQVLDISEASGQLEHLLKFMPLKSIRQFLEMPESTVIEPRYRITHNPLIKNGLFGLEAVPVYFDEPGFIEAMSSEYGAWVVYQQQVAKQLDELEAHKKLVELILNYATKGRELAEPTKV
jgi:hypothetical protein